MTTNADVTLGELARRLDQVHADLKDLRGAVAERDDVAAVTLGWQNALLAHEKQAELRERALTDRIMDLENWQTWAMRIVIGAVIAGVMALVIINPS